MEILKFQYLSSEFSLDFSLQLYKNVLESWKLSSDSRPVFGFKTLKSLKFTENSLQDKCIDSESVKGIIRNVHSIKEFKDIDKTALKSEITKEIMENILSGKFLKDARILHVFLILSFADLKKFRFYYWYLNPVILPLEKNVFCYRKLPLRISKENLQFKEFSVVIMSEQGIVQTENSLENLDKYLEVNALEKGNSLFIVLDALNWSTRNFLYGLKVYFKKIDKINFIVKDLLQEDAENNYYLEIIMPGDVKDQDLDSGTIQSVGWEKNHTGKMGPKIVDLSSVLDKEKLAQTAVDLNLKLIKWRAMPTLDLEKISKVKCCLFGAGTLGGYTARALMAWGVRNITFVDSGKVSYSNPVRQPLFRFKDCCDGVDKAVAAAEELVAIFPGMNAKGHVLNIPMPGHPLKDCKETRDLFKSMEDLVQEHDAIFLLTDSRESRWLPTLLGAAKNKIVMNAALGFDSFLVMRHGSRATDENLLGCYFCNDVVAPTDSLTDRTLDQQCTVTRPGLSLLASSLVTELFVSLLSHPLGTDAPADLSQEPSEPVDYPFGLVPHQIRGFLTHYSNLLIKGHVFNKCSACSKPILKAYQENGIDFLISVTNDSSLLEVISGLSEMFEETKAIDVEWDD